MNIEDMLSNFKEIKQRLSGDLASWPTYAELDSLDFVKEGIWVNGTSGGTGPGDDSFKQGTCHRWLVPYWMLESNDNVFTQLEYRQQVAFYGKTLSQVEERINIQATALLEMARRMKEANELTP